MKINLQMSFGVCSWSQSLLYTPKLKISTVTNKNLHTYPFPSSPFRDQETVQLLGCIPCSVTGTDDCAALDCPAVWRSGCELNPWSFNWFKIKHLKNAWMNVTPCALTNKQYKMLPNPLQAWIWGWDLWAARTQIQAPSWLPPRQAQVSHPALCCCLYRAWS